MDRILYKEQLIKKMNLLSAEKMPFLFMVDFKGTKGFVLEKSELKASGISCSINGLELGAPCSSANKSLSKLDIYPISFSEYKKSFDKVINSINDGDSYLLNLTFKTDIGSTIDLEQIYALSNAPYKMLFNDDFTFYSPESFIKIYDNKIYSFPMKGTINIAGDVVDDSTIKDAESRLLSSNKEKYEHNTIVDLIRNDLSIISTGVTVDRFRYVECIKTSDGMILQTSSQISGNLPSDWRFRFGDILFSMLPAGSISGAPKQKTLEIIEDCESSERGFYCGVMGFFDGSTVDSGVIIRYIEKGDDGRFYYRSGGGITSLSCAEDEYNELIKKVYVPII